MQSISPGITLLCVDLAFHLFILTYVHLSLTHKRLRSPVIHHISCGVLAQ